MSAVTRWLKPATTVYAHCDVPCGIYDRTRPSLRPERSPAWSSCSASCPRKTRPRRIARSSFAASRSRNSTRDREARDPGHLERLLQARTPGRYPDIHDRTWKILKLASKNKQNIDAQAAAELEARSRSSPTSSGRRRNSHRSGAF